MKRLLDKLIDYYEVESGDFFDYMYIIYDFLSEIDYKIYPDFEFYMPIEKLIAPPIGRKIEFTNKKTGGKKRYNRDDSSILIKRNGIDITLYKCTSFEYDKNIGLKCKRGELSKAIAEAILKEQKPVTLSEKIKQKRGDKCELCGWDNGTCDVHHIIPKSKGGTNNDDNLIVLCPNCHRLEHIKLKQLY